MVAHLIAQTRFVQVYRRLWFMRNQWSVPVSDYWSESHLLVAGHRYRPYLESLVLPPQEAGTVLAELLAKLDIADIETTERSMTYELSTLPSPRVAPLAGRSRTPRPARPGPRGMRLPLQGQFRGGRRAAAGRQPALADRPRGDDRKELGMGRAAARGVGEGPRPA